MARHPADHRAAPQGARLRHFLRLARQGDGAWQALARRPAPQGTRRLAEFLRIARGRLA